MEVEVVTGSKPEKIWLKWRVLKLRVDGERRQGRFCRGCACSKTGEEFVEAGVVIWLLCGLLRQNEAKLVVVEVLAH